MYSKMITYLRISTYLSTYLRESIRMLNLIPVWNIVIEVKN